MAWSARVIKVIESDLTVRGSGTEADPYRRVRQYFSLDGELLAEVDELRDREDAEAKDTP